MPEAAHDVRPETTGTTNITWPSRSIRSLGGSPGITITEYFSMEMKWAEDGVWAKPGIAIAQNTTLADRRATQKLWHHAILNEEIDAIPDGLPFWHPNSEPVYTRPYAPCLPCSFIAKQDEKRHTATGSTFCR